MGKRKINKTFFKITYFLILKKDHFLIKLLSELEFFTQFLCSYIASVYENEKFLCIFFIKLE